MKRILSVAQITVLETIARKQMYVLLILLIGIYLYFSRLSFFDLSAEASFIKLIPITGISLFGLIVTVFAAVRQLPDEISQKTIFPLLAKPLTRFQFLTGKYVGVSAIVSFAMLVLAAAFHVMLHLKGIRLTRIYWQAVILLCLQMSTFAALVILLSTMVSQAANTVLSFLLFYLLGNAGSTLEDMIYMQALPPGATWFYKAILAVTPRLDLFNISKAVMHDSDPRSWAIILPFLAYAICCSLVFLGIATLLFRKKDL